MGRCDLLTLSLNRKGAKSAKMGSGTLVKKKESGVKSCIVNNGHFQAEPPQLNGFAFTS